MMEEGDGTKIMNICIDLIFSIVSFWDKLETTRSQHLLLLKMERRKYLSNQLS